MKEIKHFEPGSDDESYQQIIGITLDAAFEVLRPAKHKGRAELIDVIGIQFEYIHKEMVEMIAGIKSLPQGADAQNFSIHVAVSQLLVTAMLKLAANGNTQWDDDELFYAQLEHRMRVIINTSCTATMVDKG